MLMRGVGEAFCALSLTLIIFVPKLFLIVTGNANNKSITTQNNSQLGPAPTVTSPTAGGAGGGGGSGASGAIGMRGVAGSTVSGGGVNGSPSLTPRKLIAARGTVGGADSGIGAGANSPLSSSMGALGLSRSHGNSESIVLSRFPASVQEKIMKERAEAAAAAAAGNSSSSAAPASSAAAASAQASDADSEPQSGLGLGLGGTLMAGFADSMPDLARPPSVPSGPSGAPHHHSQPSIPPPPPPANSSGVHGYKPSVRFSAVYPPSSRATAHTRYTLTHPLIIQRSPFLSVCLWLLMHLPLLSFCCCRVDSGTDAPPPPTGTYDGEREYGLRSDSVAPPPPDNDI